MAKTINIAIDKGTHNRLVKYESFLTVKDGIKRTHTDGINALLSEPFIMGKIDDVLDKAYDKNEEAKKTGNRWLGVQAADLAIRTLKEIRAHLQERTEK